MRLYSRLALIIGMAGGCAAPALSNRPTFWAHVLGVADAAAWFLVENGR